MQVNRQVTQPSITAKPQLSRTQETRSLTPEIKVKSRPSEKMQAYVAAKTTDDIGSEAHAREIKARIEAVPVEGIEDQSTRLPPSKMETAGKYAKAAGLGFLKGLWVVGTAGLGAFAFQSVRDKVKNYYQGTDVGVASKYFQHGRDLQQKAEKLESEASGLGAKSTLMTQRADINGKIERIQLLGDASGAQPGDLKELENQLHIIDTTLARIDSLSQEADKLRAQAGKAVEQGKNIAGSNAELIEKYGVNNTLTLASTAKSAFTATTTGAQLYALSTGTSFQESAKVGAELIGVSKEAVTAIGGVGAGVTILLEGRAFYKMSKAHNQSLNKVEMANALLTNDTGRTKMADDLEAQATKLESSFWARAKAKLNPFEKKSDPQILRAKAAAIRELNGQNLTPETLDPKVKAVVTQIKNHADLKLKRWSMVKNIAAIVGGVLALAALGPAAPFALTAVAATIGIGAAALGVGLLIHKYRLGSNRQANIDMLKNNQQQIGLKQEALSGTKETLTANKELYTKGLEFHQERQILFDRIDQEGYQLTPADREKYVLSDDGPTPLDRVATKAMIPEFESRLETVTQQLSELDTELGKLDDLKTENTMNLWHASPNDAAEAIYEGAMSGDSSMEFVAQTVLGVDITTRSKEVAIMDLARGMSIYADQ